MRLFNMSWADMMLSAVSAAIVVDPLAQLEENVTSSIWISFFSRFPGRHYQAYEDSQEP